MDYLRRRALEGKKVRPNRSTLINAAVSKIRTPMESHTELMQKMWELAVYKGSTTAARIWLEEYNSKTGNAVILELDSLEDMDEAAKCITQKVLNNELSIAAGKHILDMMNVRNGFKEAVFEPILKQLIDEQMAQIKG